MSHWYQNLTGASSRSRQARGFTIRQTATIEVSDVRPQRMILLPSRGVRAGTGGFGALAAKPSINAPLTSRALLESLAYGQPAPTAVRGVPAPKVKVIDSLGEDAAKLVEIQPGDLVSLRVAYPGLRVVPEVFYRPLVQLYFIQNRVKATTASANRRIAVTVTSSEGNPIRGAVVVAFTDFSAREGAQAETTASGTATLTLPSRFRRFERLYVYPGPGYWGALRNNVPVSADFDFVLQPIDLGYTDDVRHFYGNGADRDGAGVKVGVVDSGIALNHPDVQVTGGLCTISGESPGDYGPVGGPHGTHVAGIIAARGKPPKGIRGIAPGASLYSYRVFPANGEASNFSIIKAIDQAIRDQCDLVNMSLGGGPRDLALEAAIGDAHQAGVVCIAAAGNENRSEVAFPAAYQLSVAVSAMGRKGTFPGGTIESGAVASPYGSDKDNFIAAFSNIGPEIDVTGPGVGIISSVPDGYEVMDGTSMACPAVVGFAARLLASPAHLAILSAQRDENRSNSIVQMLLASCHLLGFKPEPNFEGAGLPS